MLYTLVVAFSVLPTLVRGLPLSPFGSSEERNTSTTMMPVANVTTRRRVTTNINSSDLIMYDVQCKHENVDSIATIFSRGYVSVQVVKRRNGTDEVVGDVAAEYLVGTFLLLIAVCLIIWAFYLALVFYVKHKQQRSFVTALQTVKAGFT